jgi:hypothetical protein
MQLSSLTPLPKQRRKQIYKLEESSSAPIEGSTLEADTGHHDDDDDDDDDGIRRQG